MELEKFRDQAVQQSLFKFTSPEDVPISLLRHWDSNAFYNNEMARFRLIIESLIKNYPLTLYNQLLDYPTRLPILLAGIDDHRATMAVEALGKATLIGQQQPEKKKGLLGNLFGGKKEQ